MEVPIYIAEINESYTSGVNFVSLVDMPAIKMKWQAFAGQDDVSMKFTTSQERQMIAGPAMVADLPILRRENGQDYYVIYTAEVIRKIVEKFAANGNYNNINLMHSSVQPNSVHMVECFIIDRERGINPPKGFESLTDGSWWLGHKINDPALFETCKSTFQGYSVEGFFDLVPQMSEEQKLVEELVDVLTKSSKILN
jgi:hypothetical protein